jgi:hypothetical protein
MINLTVGVKAKKKQLEKAAFGSVLLVHHRDTDPPVARVFGVTGVVGRRIGHTFNLGKSIARNSFFLNDLSSFLGTFCRQGPVVSIVCVGKLHAVGMTANGHFVGQCCQCFGHLCKQGLGSRRHGGGAQTKHGEVGFVDDLYAQAIFVAGK